MICPQILCLSLVLFAAMEVKAVKVGGPKLHGPEEHENIKPQLLKILESSNSELQVKEITSYHTQVVAGTKHIVEYLATVRGSEGDKRCKTVWVEQPWKSAEPQFTETKCE